VSGAALGTVPGSTSGVPSGPSAPGVQVPSVSAPSHADAPGAPDAGQVDQPSPPKVNSSAPDVSVPTPPVSTPSVPDTTSGNGAVKGAGVGN
jgi:hypothetical protein